MTPEEFVSYIENFERPVFVVLVGFPASGKSTWCKNVKELKEDVQVISRDRIIEDFAFENGITYGQAFFDIDQKAVDKIHNKEIDDALLLNKTIVMDKTHLTFRSRNQYSGKASSKYFKMSILFNVDENIRNSRNEQRKNKVISDDVLRRMEKQFDIKSIDDLSKEKFFDVCYEVAQ